MGSQKRRHPLAKRGLPLSPSPFQAKDTGKMVHVLLKFLLVSMKPVGFQTFSVVPRSLGSLVRERKPRPGFQQTGSDRWHFAHLFEPNAGSPAAGDQAIQGIKVCLGPLHFRAGTAPSDTRFQPGKMSRSLRSQDASSRRLELVMNEAAEPAANAQVLSEASGVSMALPVAPLG